MARRKRGTMWRSSRRRRSKQAWFGDSAYGLVAPTTGVADNDALLAVNDYSLSVGSKERVRVKRIIFEFWWTPVSPSAAADGSFIVDVGLIVMTPDAMAAATTASARVNDFVLLEGRIIRAKSFPFTEQGRETAVGVRPNAKRPVQLHWNIRCNFQLEEPEQLYLYQLRSDVDGVTDTYEYSYNSRVLYER